MSFLSKTFLSFLSAILDGANTAEDSKCWHFAFAISFIWQDIQFLHTELSTMISFLSFHWGPQYLIGFYFWMSLISLLIMAHVLPGLM